MSIMQMLDLFYKIKRENGYEWSIELRLDTMVDFVLEVRDNNGDIVVFSNSYTLQKTYEDVYCKLKKYDVINK